MKFILTRGARDNTYKECRCSLFLGSKNSFTVYFDQVTPEIGLNDGNFYSLKELHGITTEIFLQREGISLEGCFVNINGKWHRDGFLFRFDC